MFFLGPIIFNALVGIAVSLASTLIAQIFAQDKKQAQAGVRGSVQLGGDNPLAFIMGRYATGGQLDYAGTYGNDGDTPNAFYTKVVSVSDLPVRGLAGLFVNGERVTILDGGDERGAPVEQYRVDDKDHLWVKFYDGTSNTAPDAFLLSKFGSDPDRPWMNDMLGRGVAYAVITALVNRELFSGLPDYLIEVDGIPLNDRRGGGAQHDNPIVGIDHILGGLSYDGQWVYGPQSIGIARRPLATWQPQMDKCDALVDGEKAFRFGYEVVVDQEPHVVIGEYLKACEGRIAEIGGIYKVLVGGPDAPVASFTDEDIVITEGQSYDPFPGLEATFNGITATYPEPLEAWENKEAPPRYRSDLEILDDNRRLPFSTNYGAVPYPVQVQRLMRAAIEETRRFRRHVHTMPPEWWEYEPLDAVVWDSERNGYIGKVFLITAQDDLGNGNQIPALQEQDPSDYDWASDFQLPWDVVPLVISRPEPQVVTGWAVTPEIIYDAAGNARRPAVRFSWDGEVDDVRAVGYQLRVKATLDLVFDDSTDNVKAGSIVVASAAILPNQALQGRGIYHPYSGRRTDWTEWLDVTTPDIRLGAFDLYEGVIGFEHLQEDIAEYQEWISEGVREALDEAQRIAMLTVSQDLSNYSSIQTVKKEIKLTEGRVTAAYESAITVAVGPDSALVQRIENLEVSIDEDLASAIASLTTQIEANTQGIKAVSQDVVALDVKVGGNLSSAVQSLTAQINTVGNRVTTVSQALTALETKAGNDLATATSLLSTRITTADNKAVAAQNAINAEADRVDALTVTVDGVSAEANFRMGVTAGRDGYASRIGMQARVGSTGNYRAASLFIDVPSFVSSPTRVTVLADQFVVANGASGAAFNPFIVQNGTVYISNARIKDLTGDNILANSITANRLQTNSINASEYLLNGTVITDKIAGNAVTDTFSYMDNGDIFVRGNGIATVAGLDVFVPAGCKVYLWAITRAEKIDTTNGTLSYFRMRRGGTWIQEKFQRFDTGTENRHAQNVIFNVIDTPSQGWHFYNVETAGDFTKHYARSIIALVVKK